MTLTRFVTLKYLNTGLIFYGKDLVPGTLDAALKEEREFLKKSNEYWNWNEHRRTQHRMPRGQFSRYLDREESRHIDRQRTSWYCKNVLASKGIRLPLR